MEASLRQAHDELCLHVAFTGQHDAADVVHLAFIVAEQIFQLSDIIFQLVQVLARLHLASYMLAHYINPQFIVIRSTGDRCAQLPCMDAPAGSP